MSNDLYRKDDFTVTSFWGGEERGPCIQITKGVSYVQLEQEEAKEVVYAINNWLGKKV
jgi:hypothetical protein